MHNKPHTESARAKIRLARSRQIITDEHKRKIGEGLRGHPVSEYTKEKIRLSHLGKKGPSPSPEVREKLRSALKGKKRPPFSVEWRRNIGLSHSGSRSPRWRGGVSRELQRYSWTQNFVETIRERDGYLCQRCHKEQVGRAFHVHHLDGDKRNSDLDNLILLCPTCHNHIHLRHCFLAIPLDVVWT